MLHLAQNQDYPPALYIVSTPIGNLADITVRALYVLSIVDYIACEDTRHTGLLLQNYAIKAKTISCHEHNQKQMSQTILNYLQQGLRIAYVSDAGTPAISDPGSILVDTVLKAKFKVIPISGISTPTALMSVAGQITQDNSSNYCFAGFLPTSNKAKLDYLEKLANYRIPIIFFESPKRIEQTLKDLKIHFNNRKIVIARELTKRFEEIIYANINEDIKINPKGEFCILIHGDDTKESNPQLAVKLLKELIPQIGTKQSSKIVANCLDMPQKLIYNLALELNI